MGNPREVEHVVIIWVARLAWARAGSRELRVTLKGRQERWDVKHALSIAGGKGSVYECDPGMEWGAVASCPVAGLR